MRANILFVAICSVFVTAAPAHSKDASDSYEDRPFLQDLARKVPLSAELAGAELSVVRADRNSRILVLSNKGLLRIHEGELVPEHLYRPIRDMQVKGLQTYRGQFVYLTDGAVLSNAWAGNILTPHKMHDARLFEMGRDFDFLLTGEGAVTYSSKAGDVRQLEAPQAEVRQLLFDGRRNRFLILSNDAVCCYAPGKKCKKVLEDENLACLELADNNTILIVGTRDGYVELDAGSFRRRSGMNQKLPCTDIRCVRQIGKDHTLYDLCDEYGILMMVGWSCHWEHEQYLGKPVDGRYGGVTSAEDVDLIGESWRDQVIWLRNHPSIYVWAVGSDKVPAPELERKYIETFEKYDPSRPYLVSTGGVGSEQGIIGDDVVVSEISGGSGVKMLGPYAYTPPVYWYTDTTRGGAYGFNTETCPGAVVPPLESIRKMIGEDHLWPIDEFWHFHCALNEFDTLDRHREAIDRRYGGADSVEQFAMKAQVLNYELMRPMFEAFAANRPVATGVVQWMLNAAWPKMYWQLYDKFLMPTGAFYGARKACQPLHLLYNYGDHSVYAVNGLPATFRDIKATIRVLEIDSAEVFGETVDISMDPESSAKVLDLPEFDRISTTYFLDLRLAGQRVNFYWLSTKPDVLDYEARVEPWAYYTPSKEFADFTALNSLPAAKVEIEYSFQTAAGTFRSQSTAGICKPEPQEFLVVRPKTR